jgi:hypothetical protein
VDSGDASMPQSRNTAPESAPGLGGLAGTPGAVREKRGAGAAWRTPSISMIVPRPDMCGCPGTSRSDSTGVTQASRSANTAAHSSLVRLANAAVNASRSTGQPASSYCAGTAAGSSPSPSSSSA